MTIRKTLGVTLAICAIAPAAAFAANITGTNGNDQLVGTPSIDTINALNGDDVAFGLGNKDTINAGSGNDVIFGDGSCPPGTTNISYCSTGETSADGNDTISGGSGFDALFGQGGNDTITGGDDSDYVDGGSGNDHLSGGDDADIINGGSGADTISGRGGNDLILARDRVKDTITCGSGYDAVIADHIDSVNRDCESVSRA